MCLEDHNDRQTSTSNYMMIEIAIGQENHTLGELACDDRMTSLMIELNHPEDPIMTSHLDNNANVVQDLIGDINNINEECIGERMLGGVTGSKSSS